MSYSPVSCRLSQVQPPPGTATEVVLPKHTILFLAANPVGTDRLALEEEARAIRVALERSCHRDQFQLETRGAARRLDLLDELRKLKPTIVHFSGHGGTGELSSGADAYRDLAGAGGVAEEVVDGAPPRGLFFQGPDGSAQLVSTAAIQQTFGATGESVKLVVLNACYSDAQAEALLPHVGCVVGMHGSIRDDAARSFAIGFYGGLGERESVAAAYLQGCAAISLEGLPDGDKPRLLTHEGVHAELIVLAELASDESVSQSRGSEARLETRGAANAPMDVLATQSRGRTVATPMPAYPSVEVQALSERLRDAHERKQALRDAGLATDEVNREILQLRRQLREGGQLRAGDTLGDGRYLLIRPVGRGGFAVVWEAYDCMEQQRVAIKILHANLAGDPQRRERFFRGAQAMTKLLHPAVVRVLEPKGEDGGFYYFVMEFVPGDNLREAVLMRRLRRDELWPIVLQVGDALAMAHASGMIHRDIKPANILLDEQGDAKLTDFDLVGANDTTGGTRTGALGTVVYAAPECLEQPQVATTRADVYGLGMTAIFCLSGRDLSLSTFKNPESTIAELDCTSHIQEALLRAVAWDPEARFANAGTMTTALRAALEQHHDDIRAESVTNKRVTHRTIIIGTLVIATGIFALSMRPKASPSSPVIDNENSSAIIAQRDDSTIAYDCGSGIPDVKSGTCLCPKGQRPGVHRDPQLGVRAICLPGKSVTLRLTEATSKDLCVHGSIFDGEQIVVTGVDVCVAHSRAFSLQSGNYIYRFTQDHPGHLTLRAIDDYSGKSYASSQFDDINIHNDHVLVFTVP